MNDGPKVTRLSQVRTYPFNPDRELWDTVNRDRPAHKPPPVSGNKGTADSGGSSGDRDIADPPLTMMQMDLATSPSTAAPLVQTWRERRARRNL